MDGNEGEGMKVGVSYESKNLSKAIKYKFEL